jgi:hypothetical protein
MVKGMTKPVVVKKMVLLPYELSDREQVFSLLSFLPTLYPGGYEWLDRRLEEVLLGAARCTLARVSRRIAGIAIETPKGNGIVKLSTIFVDPKFRHRRIGTALLRNCTNLWRLDSIENCYITADHRIAPDLSPLLAKFSFKEKSVISNRYGPGRHEVVFVRGPH